MAKNPRTYVAELIRKLMPNQTEDGVDLSQGYRIFSQADEGTLFFNQPESDQYRHALSRLTIHFSKNDDISPRTIEKALQRAIFYAIDIQHRRTEQSFEERTETATAALCDALTQPAQTYICFVPVNGLDEVGLPYRFGLVTFLNFNETQLRRFRQAIRRHSVSEEQMAVRKHLLKSVRQSCIWNAPCARIGVTAKDPYAAMTLARQKVRVTIDCINFFSRLIPYNEGWLYLPGEAVSTLVFTPVLSEDCAFHFDNERHGPSRRFNVRNLQQTEYLRPFVKKVDAMLRKQQPTDIDQLFLSSIQWAGRATVEMRREEAFLLYAIAYESLVLPNTEPRELTYRLRIRTAHLVGRTAEDRSRIIDDVKELYGIRSQIVHNGHYQVTDDARLRIQSLVRRVIFALLRSKGVQKIKSKKQLDQWFENQVLT